MGCAAVLLNMAEKVKTEIFWNVGYSKVIVKEVVKVLGI